MTVFLQSGVAVLHVAKLIMLNVSLVVPLNLQTIVFISVLQLAALKCCLNRDHCEREAYFVDVAVIFVAVSGPLSSLWLLL